MPIKIKSITEFRKTVCAVPWAHLAFEPSGKVVPCCLTSTYNYFAGDLTTQTIDEIWNSDNMKKLRKEMIEGTEPQICSKCFDREKVTGESGRLYHARDFPEVLKSIPNITEPDGTCTEMKLRYWDFRFSNLCNYKCRSCGPRYSSAWVPDAKKMGWISEQDKVWNIENVDEKTNFDFLKEQVQYVEKVYFAGGEPLLMDEHWQILDLLLENKKFDVKVSYNTNLSVLSYGKKNVLDYWSKWEPGKLEIWPSLDEIGERAELIRSGTVWPKVEENLKELIKLDNVIVRPGLTIGAWNVFRIPEIVMHLVDIGVISANPKFGYYYNNFFINLLEQPSHYHVSILPEEFRHQTINKLTSFMEMYNKKFNTKIDHLLTHILHELTKPTDFTSAKRFLEVTSQLDTIRHENTFTTIPEMVAVKEGLLRPDSPLAKKVINITPIPMDVPDDPVAKPISLRSGNVVEIKRERKPMILTWVINNICTNHCSYCPPDVHAGTNHHYDWSHAKSFIEECVSRYESIHCSISGGEPTVSPFFKDLVNLIYDTGGTIHLTTNLVRPLRYWEGFAEHFSSIAVSYHPEFITTEEQEDEWIEKIQYIHNKTNVSVRIMMLPKLWDQCYKFYQKLVNEDIKCAIEMVRILPNFGSGENYCDIEYTPEQELVLLTTPLYNKCETVPGSRPINLDSTIVYEYGGTAPLSYEQVTHLENSKLANFNNWTCDIGLESLFVYYDGSIQRGNCNVGGKLGNITDLVNMNWPSTSITCNKTLCHCAADVMVSKRMPKDAE